MKIRKYAGPNANATAFELDATGSTLYFSYETLVVLHDEPNSEVYARHNDWGNTTGRHIGKALAELGMEPNGRISEYEMKEALDRVFEDELNARVRRN